jgi:hypothetical protein
MSAEVKEYYVRKPSGDALQLKSETRPLHVLDYIVIWDEHEGASPIWLPRNKKIAHDVVHGTSRCASPRTPPPALAPPALAKKKTG